MKSKKTKKIWLLAVSLAVFLGLFLASLGWTANDKESHCMFAESQTVFCPINFLQHVAKWQEFSVAIVSDLLIISLLLIVAAVYQDISRFDLTFWLYKFRQRFKLFLHLLFLNPLLKAFQSGILHPKIYPAS